MYSLIQAESPTKSISFDKNCDRNGFKKGRHKIGSEMRITCLLFKCNLFTYFGSWLLINISLVRESMGATGESYVSNTYFMSVTCLL